MSMEQRRRVVVSISSGLSMRTISCIDDVSGLVSILVARQVKLLRMIYSKNKHIRKFRCFGLPML